jgi:radical SAM protein with 4Fe4S-binding SPASM domain
MESFVDRWQQRLGMYSLTGASHFARQRPDRAVTIMTPSKRAPCRRLFSRAMVLADGRVTTCDQDYTGRQVVGSLRDESFLSLWQSPLLSNIRSQRHDGCALCPKCDEWHRP